MSPEQRETTSNTESAPNNLSHGGLGSESYSATPATQSKTSLSGRKKLLIVAGAAVVLLLGGAAYAYNAWNNNPDKVLADAFQNSFFKPLTNANGTLKFDSDGTNLGVDFNLVANKDNEAQITADLTVATGAAEVKAGVVVVTAKNGDILIKVKDAKKLLSTFTGGQAEAEALYADLVNKVDNKWIKITQAELQELTGTSQGENDKQISCAQDAFKSLQTDKKQQDEVRKLFEANRFVSVAETLPSEKVGTYNSHHYKLGFDEGKGKAFGKAFENTAFFKKLDACTDGQLKDETADSDANSQEDVPTVEVWVDKGSHQLTKLKVASKESGSNGSIEVVTDFNKPQNVTIPNGDTTIKELQAEFEKAIQSYYGDIGIDDPSLMTQ